MPQHDVAAEDDPATHAAEDKSVEDTAHREAQRTWNPRGEHDDELVQEQPRDATAPDDEVLILAEGRVASRHGLLNGHLLTDLWLQGALLAR
jgi:hypothetical protein